jgi:hypothetical protein
VKEKLQTRVCRFSFSPRCALLRAMQIGIIGLPNSTKTTIFNALTRGQIETAGFLASSPKVPLFLKALINLGLSDRAPLVLLPELDYTFRNTHGAPTRALNEFMAGHHANRLRELNKTTMQRYAAELRAHEDFPLSRRVPRILHRR